jgi:hypothetical protein
VKSPAVIHFKCLDTFALQGVARSFGSGAAGVRLTRDGLSKHLRPSEREREREGEAREEAAKADLDDLLAREEKCDTLIPHVTEAAQIMLPPAPSRRGSMASLATIEMGLRKPTMWAVALLTLGVSFGVGLARVASNAAAIDPGAVSAAAAPRGAQSIAPPIVFRAPPAVAPAGAPMTIALTTIVGRRHHHSSSGAAQAALGSTPDVDGTPRVTDKPVTDTKKAAVADKKTDAVDSKSDDGDETSAAAAANARAHSELSNSL